MKRPSKAKRPRPHRVCIDLSAEKYKQLVSMAQIEDAALSAVGRRLLEAAIDAEDYDRPETEEEKEARYLREAVEFLGRPLEEGECGRCYVAHCPEHQS